MTQPLPSLPPPAPTPTRAPADGAAAPEAAGFDGMLREQMGHAGPADRPGAPEAAAEPVTNASASGPAAAAPEELAHLPAEVVEMLERQVDPQTTVPLPVEPVDGQAELPGGTTLPGTVPSPAVPAPALAAPPVVANPVAVADVPREAATRTAVSARPVVPPASQPRAGAGPGSGPVFQEAPEAAVAKAVEALAEVAESPAAGRAAPASPLPQVAAAPSPALQAVSAAGPRFQALEPVNVPVADPDWGGALGARLVVSAAQGVQSASIALNPQDLGPLKLTLTVNEDEARVSFVSNHVAVRDAIEAALPRLREMLAEQGINLTDVDVSSGGHRPGDGRGDAPRDGAGGGRDRDHAAAVSTGAPSRMSDSLVDTFA